MILGALRITPLLLLCVPAMILAPCYTYYMAVSKGEEKPYPHTTVTDTATHYPQDIFFRYIMLVCSSVLALTFYALFRWAEWQARRTGFPKPPFYQFYLAEASIFCYGVTIGTIDGEGIGNLHTPCAIIFFIIWLVTIVNMTAYLTKMRNWDTSTISLPSLRVKQALSVYIILIWAYCLFYTYVAPSTDKFKYTVIVEWNSVLINLLWVLTLVF